MNEHGTKTYLNSEYLFVYIEKKFQVLYKKFLIWILFQDLKKKIIENYVFHVMLLFSSQMIYHAVSLRFM